MTITHRDYTSRLNRPLWIDAEKIVQAFTNILSSAIGSVEENGCVAIDPNLPVRVGCWRSSATTASASDTMRLTACCDPFGEAEMRHHGGLGLGLPIASGLIRLHDGELTLRSEIGKVTTIEVALPIERVLPVSGICCRDGAAEGRSAAPRS
jgi:signal transduction histidine kinase